MTEQLTDADLREIGATFVMMLAAQAAMGHDRPASSTLYMDPAALTPNQQIVRAAFALDSLTEDPTARACVEQFVERYGLLDVVAAAVED